MLTLFRIAIICSLVPPIVGLVAVVGWTLELPGMTVAPMIWVYDWTTPIVKLSLGLYALSFLVAFRWRRDQLKSFVRTGIVLAASIVACLLSYHLAARSLGPVVTARLTVTVVNNTSSPVSGFRVIGTKFDHELGSIQSRDSVSYSVFTFCEGRVDYIAQTERGVDSGTVVDYSDPEAIGTYRVVVNTSGIVTRRGVSAFR